VSIARRTIHWGAWIPSGIPAQGRLGVYLVGTSRVSPVNGSRIRSHPRSHPAPYPLCQRQRNSSGPRFHRRNRPR